MRLDELTVRIVVTVGPEAPPEPQSGMLGELQGVIAVLDKPGVTKLLACEPKKVSPIGRPPEGETVCFVHIVGKTDEKVLEVVRGLDGRIVAEEVGTGDDRPPREELNADRFDELSAGWSRYRGGWEPTTETTGEVFEVPKPYSVGRHVLDKTTIGERILGGSKSERKAERVLAEERFVARLPAGIDPKRPAGLLVWVNPIPDAAPPPVIFEAADEAGLIVISAGNSGNTRNAWERFQLALDAVATATRRWHVDPRRVYIAGMSGGGGVAAIMAGCFPEVFTAAIPIAKLSSYEHRPTGVGTYYPAEYRRPSAKLFALFREHPLAAIVGDKDPNYESVKTGVDMMRKDGVNARVFEHEGMGHEMPTAEWFAEAVRWVDGPYQEVKKAEAEAAAKAMDVYTGRYPDGKALDEAGKRLLERVVEAGPWTGPAWEAVGVLEGR